MARIHRKRSALRAKVYTRWLRMAMNVLGMTLCAGGEAALVWLLITGNFMGASVQTVWGGAFVLLAVAGLLAWRLRTNRRIWHILRAGVRGEAAALRQLARSLPRDWHVFSNVVAAHEGRTSEMDLVAVGPGGVYVVEVKNYSGEVSGDADAQELTHRSHGRSEQVYNPMRQVATHVHRLSGLLRAAGCGVWVRGAVYFVSPEVKVYLRGQGRVPCYTGQELRTLVRDMRQGQLPLQAAQIRAITAVLKRL